MENKTSVKTPKNSQIIGVQFNTKSPKYKNKNYYYKTNKQVEKGDKIQVDTFNHKGVDVVVSKVNYKGKTRNNLKTY